MLHVFETHVVESQTAAIHSYTAAIHEFITCISQQEQGNMSSTKKKKKLLHGLLEELLKQRQS